jgi:hypothetical protein
VWVTVVIKFRHRNIDAFKSFKVDLFKLRLYLYINAASPCCLVAMSKKALQQKDVIVKLIVGAGQASPSPPVGPALGSKGVKSMDFCKVDHVNDPLERALGLLTEGFRNSMLEQQTTSLALLYLRASPSDPTDLSHSN